MNKKELESDNSYLRERIAEMENNRLSEAKLLFQCADLLVKNQALREFANECETVRRNFRDNGESDKAGAAYYLIFMSGKAEKALNQNVVSDLPRGG
jgi:hypothetical protein